MTHRDNTDHHCGNLERYLLRYCLITVLIREVVLYLTTIIPNGSSVNGSTMQRIKILILLNWAL